MVVSSINSAKYKQYDSKGNIISAGNKPYTTVSNETSHGVDTRYDFSDRGGPSGGSKGVTTGNQTTTNYDASGNIINQTQSNPTYVSLFGRSSGGSSIQAAQAPSYSPLVKSTVQPQGAERSADGTPGTGYMTDEEKKRRGIVDITQQVTPGFEGSTQKFNQGQLTEDQLRARYEADLASGASKEQMQREYGDMGAPAGMGAVGSQERMARQKQQAADKAIQDELQGLTRAGQLFDRGNEDLTMGRDRTTEQNAQDVERAKEDRQFQLDEYRKNVNRNIEDTGKQRDETMQTIRRQSAALGLNVVSTYQQSYKNTQDKFNNVINRMQEDLSTTEGRSTLEDKRLDADYTRATKQLLQDYEKESTRLKQDFEYSTRDYRENLILDANKLVEQYGLSSDKLGARLQELSLDAFNKVETAYGSFLDNSQKQTDILDSQVNNVLDTRNKYLTQQKTYADNFLAGSQNMTITDLNAMVRDGQISEQMAQQTLGQVVQMALDTIDNATADGVGIQFQDQIIEAINNGMTPMQAIQQVMASEEFAPVVAKMQEMGLNPYEKALATLQIQQGKQGLLKGQQDIQQGNIDTQLKQAELNALNGGGQTVLNETPVDTGIKSVNGGNVKLAPTVAVMVQNAQSSLQQQGIDLKIADSYRSTETQANAYNSGKPGVAPPGQSRHEKGQAIDLSQLSKDGMKNEKVFQALRDAGLQQLPGERWHWSYGEMGGGNQDEKDTLLSLVKKGGLTKTDQKEIADKAIKQGRSKEFNEALKKGAVVDLSDGQITQYNRETDRFLGNAVVKGFEEGLTQFQGLGHALSEKSGPGDMAGVFTFMKTLDPTSVVREAEFENAAKSAGVTERRGNVYDNLTEGKILTSSQAEDFKKIAKVFIEQKAQSYDRLYKNMLNSYDNFGIPQDLAPLKASDQLREYLVTTGQAPQQNTVKAKRGEFEPTAGLQSSPLFKLTQ